MTRAEGWDHMELSVAKEVKGIPYLSRKGNDWISFSNKLILIIH